MNEGDEEQLTLKLISKLESLEAENTRLRRERELALSQNDFLSSKISTMDSALENAVAEITNLEERSNIFPTQQQQQRKYHKHAHTKTSPS